LSSPIRRTLYALLIASQSPNRRTWFLFLLYFLFPFSFSPRNHPLVACYI
jgi:hypothetical protein